MNSVSNRKQLFLRLLLGAVFVPGFGIIPAILIGIVPPAHGPPWSTPGRITLAATFVAIGAALSVYAIWKIPVGVELSEALTVHYVFRNRAIRADQIRDVSVKDRSVTLRSPGSLPMTANDTLLTICLLDNWQLTLSLPPATAAAFRHTVLRWCQLATEDPLT
jgi:hypothetical protein